MAPHSGKGGKSKHHFLIGEYEHSLDEKKRLLIPAKFRLFLENGFILMPWFNECLVIIPVENFEPLYQRLSSLPMEDPSARLILRFFGGAQEGYMDGQGRVIIPEGLRRYAHIEREVVVAGRVSYIEVWSTVVWEFYKKTLQADAIQRDLAKFSLSWPIGPRAEWTGGMGGHGREEETLPPPRPGRRRGEPSQT